MIKAGLAVLALAMVGGPLEQRSQALECPTCQNGPFSRGGGPFTPVAGDVSGGHTLSPGICGNTSNGFILLSVNNQGKYIDFQFNANTKGPKWDLWDSGVTFKSKPSCALVDQAGNSKFTQPNFVAVGLGTDGHLHSAGGEYAVNGYPQANPSPINKIDTTRPVDEVIDASTTYPAGPGIASVLFTATSGITLVVAVDSNNVVWAYTKIAPFFYSKWSAPQRCGVLPTGWTAYGAPSLDNRAPNFGTNFDIVFHLQNTSTHQDALWAGSILTTVNGQVDSFQLAQVKGTLTGVTVNDAPALVWDPDINVETVFFRSGNQMLQTSGNPIDLGDYPVVSAEPPAPNWPTSFNPTPNSPAVAWGSYDIGYYVIIARGSDGHLYEAESDREANLTP
jgi:hypothetical protein